jgi:antitoxin (DNA-binding transcriptional repressor) of toxin-antitoxin stability system
MSMTKRVTATTAARELSDLLDQVERYGEEFVVERHGRAIASIGPSGAVGRRVTWAQVRDELIRRRPDPGFAAALRDIRRRQPKLPKDKWARSSTRPS